MQIEFLGTGGAITIPRPGCDCRICAEARARRIPYSRAGPSVFVHGPDALIDTPEEIAEQLNRSRVTQIDACFYSHWHPDHTMGRRVWETRNFDWRHWPPRNIRTDIYLPHQVAQDFRQWLGTWDHLAHLERQGVARVITLADGDTVTLGNTRICPFRLAEDYVYAFVFEEDGRRVLIAPDELFGWEPPPEIQGVDLAVIPMGIVELDPFTGERRFPADHPVLKSEATFAQTLEIVRKLDAKRVIMTHIEEPSQIAYDDLQRLEAKLKNEGFNITFAYDTWLMEV